MEPFDAWAKDLRETYDGEHERVMKTLHKNCNAVWKHEGPVMVLKKPCDCPQRNSAYWGKNAQEVFG